METFLRQRAAIKKQLTDVTIAPEIRTGLSIKGINCNCV